METLLHLRIFHANATNTVLFEQLINYEFHLFSKFGKYEVFIFHVDLFNVNSPRQSLEEFSFSSYSWFQTMFPSIMMYIYLNLYVCKCVLNYIYELFNTVFLFYFCYLTPKRNETLDFSHRIRWSMKLAPEINGH